MIKYSNGNKKIGTDTFIINITSATNCPSKKMGLCNIEDGKCYAMKAERMYPNVLPYRQQQEVLWDEYSGKDIGLSLLAEARKKKTPIRFIRFSESGDFRCQEDVEKMKEICLAVRRENVKVYGYTARRDLDFRYLPSNMVVNGSGFMVSNKFTAVHKKNSDDIFCNGDCRVCDLCKEKNKLDIKVLYH